MEPFAIFDVAEECLARHGDLIILATFVRAATHELVLIEVELIPCQAGNNHGLVLAVRAA